MTFTCGRCQLEVDELWGTVALYSRVGNWSGIDLCRSCTGIAYAYVLSQPLQQETTMSLVYDYLIDPDDIDDAEHARVCKCHECDPDFHMERQREERMMEAS